MLRLKASPVISAAASALMDSRRWLGLICALIVGFAAVAFSLAQSGGGANRGAVPAGWYGKSIALVVGIDDYQNGISTLDAAVSDANHVEAALRAQGFTVYKLINGQATRDEIRRYLMDVIPHKLGPADRFLFFFSGHGSTESVPGGQLGYLIPVDALHGQTYSFISMKEIRDILRDKYVSKHVLIVADACFSGLLTGRGSSTSASVNEALRQDGKMVLTAGGKGEVAWDGLFTDIFVQGISGRADSNADGAVTFGELAVFTRQRVSDRSNDEQHPSYGWWEGEGEMVFKYGGSSEVQTASTPKPPQPPRPSTPAGMVLIPGGTFWMGCSPGDKTCIEWESPRHQVTLSAFYMDIYEVTQTRYQQATGNNPTRFGICPNCPVANVTWNDAKKYCEQLGKRLPTEAEWEYAARGGTTGQYYGPIDDVGWHDGISGGQMHPVGQKQANHYGLYDMLGNLNEWTADWFDEDYYKSSPSRDPRGPSSGTSRVTRGGCWSWQPEALTASFRDKEEPDRLPFASVLGFRCAKDAK